MKPIFRAAAILAAVVCIGQQALGQQASPCSKRVTQSSVIPCALRASLSVRVERHELDAAEGRRLAASPLFPSNPVVSLTASRRSAPGREAFNWHASLGQELEIAGQRGLRRDSARAEADAQSKRVLLSQRNAAAAALAAFFEALAAREEQILARRLEAVAEAVAAAAQARAEKGLIAPVDADLASMTSVRTLQGKLAADRLVAGTNATLATLLGLDPTAGSVEVEGALAPLPGTGASARAISGARPSERPEVQALEDERRAMELRAAAFRRSRVPNPTLSAFVDHDGFGERVVGIGLSLPIPIPGNIGRTYDGEVAEAEALAGRAATARDQVRREIRLELATAAEALETRRQEVAAFSPELLSNADQGLRALGQEVEAGRLTIRDAVTAEQALIGFLQAHIAARRAWCLASVDLARAAGTPLERGIP